MWNGTMFVDLDWPLNASSLLSASAELLVLWAPPPLHNSNWNLFSGVLNTRRRENFATFDRSRRLSWKRCEIGQWLLGSLKSQVANRSVTLPVTLIDLKTVCEGHIIPAYLRNYILSYVCLRPTKFDMVTWERERRVSPLSATIK